MCLSISASSPIAAVVPSPRSGTLLWLTPSTSRSSSESTSQRLNYRRCVCVCVCLFVCGHLCHGHTSSDRRLCLRAPSGCRSWSAGSRGRPDASRAPWSVTWPPTSATAASPETRSRWPASSGSPATVQNAHTHIHIHTQAHTHTHVFKLEFRVGVKFCLLLAVS